MANFHSDGMKAMYFSVYFFCIFLEFNEMLVKPKLAKPKIIIYHKEGKNVHAILVAARYTNILSPLAFI